MKYYIIVCAVMLLYSRAYFIDMCNDGNDFACLLWFTFIQKAKKSHKMASKYHHVSKAFSCCRLRLTYT